MLNEATTEIVRLTEKMKAAFDALSAAEKDGRADDVAAARKTISATLNEIEAVAKKANA